MITDKLDNLEQRLTHYMNCRLADCKQCKEFMSNMTDTNWSEIIK